MREGIGSISLYNIIIIFLVIMFEIYEGYNSESSSGRTGSAEKINEYLSSIGYRATSPKLCPTRNGMESISKISINEGYDFCLYRRVEETKNYDGRYFTYGVLTYMYFDLPIIGDAARFPVYAKTNSIFCFNYQGICDEVGEW